MFFYGQFDCTMDEKGRIKMPASLRKQFSEEDGNRFIMAKDLEDCLVIYPLKTWKKTAQKLENLDDFNLEHRKFINASTIGLTDIELDSADRFLVSKSLMRYLGNGKDIILKGNGDKVQIWEASKFEQFTQGNISNIQSLSVEVSRFLQGKNGKTEA